MTVVNPEIQTMLYAVIIYAMFSVLYKHNPIYSFFEQVLIGVTLANLFMGNYQTIVSSILVPLGTGRTDLIIPLVLGLLYFTIFIPRLALISRTVISARVGGSLGFAVGLLMSIQTAALVTLAGTAATNPLAILSLIIIAFTLMYFTFSRWMDERLPLIRKIATYVVIGYFAGFGATLYVTKLDIFVGWMAIIGTGSGLWVAVAAGLVVAIDALVGWKKILGLK
jgi:hypothetical protein